MATFDVNREPRAYSDDSESDSDAENQETREEDEVLIDEELNELAEEEFKIRPLHQHNERARFQQSPRAPVPIGAPTIRAKPGAWFNELTDTSRIVIRGGDDTKEFIESLDDYKDFHPALIANLREMGAVELTAIQKAVWHVILNKFRYNLKFQAQTGSGKTLAYLVPLLNWIFKLKEEVSSAKNAPFAIVFVPTKELAIQVANIAKQLSKRMDLGITCSADARLRITGGSHLHVTTLGKLKSHLVPSDGRCYPLISLKNVKFVVCDEADKYFEDTYDSDDIHHVLGAIREANPMSRIYALSATLSDEFDVYMEEEVDGKKMVPFEIFDKKITPPTIEHQTTVLRPRMAPIAIIMLLQRIMKDGAMPKTVIFTNSCNQCDILVYHLITYGFRALSLTSKWTNKSRQKVIDEFNGGKTKILVCSDVACAGVDWDIDVVVNYHLPPRQHFHRFVHRIGRTGRAGKKGMVYSFFYGGLRARADQIYAADFLAQLRQLQFPIPPALVQESLYFTEIPGVDIVDNTQTAEYEKLVESDDAGFVDGVPQ